MAANLSRRRLSATLFNDDCINVLKTLPTNSFHALVTDPPAGISYKGSDWDGDKGGRNRWVEWLTGILTECSRVLRPGAYGVVWAIPRNAQWTATAIENAGFQVRDVIVHLFGEGVPRGRALDPTGKRKGAWSTLKPASEHWVLCKKPIAEGDLLSNVKKYGTGTLNIDDCRIPPSSNEKWISPRFPTNVMLTHDKRCAASCVTDCPVSEIDRQSGKESSRFFKRFYYCSKASESERRLGCGSNNHPTVKSVELMRYLLRLVTPHGGVVLDPFMGSGTTGIAAFEEGRYFVGIEKEKRYFSIASKRNKFVNPDCAVAIRYRKQELVQLLTGRR